MTDEQIDDVLMKPLARVKFEYFREKLGVLQIEFLPRGSDESVCPSNVVVGLVPSMVRCNCRALLTWW